MNNNNLFLDINRRGSCSPNNAEYGHFTLLFCRGRQRNLPRIITHAHSVAVAVVVFSSFRPSPTVTFPHSLQTGSRRGRKKISASAQQKNSESPNKRCDQSTNTLRNTCDLTDSTIPYKIRSEQLRFNPQTFPTLTSEPLSQNIGFERVFILLPT